MKDYDVWDAIFDQTPMILRWLLGVLTLGLFTLATAIYRWNRHDVQAIAEQQAKDTERIHDRITRLEDKLDARTNEMNRHLIEIATNTRNLPRRKTDYADDQT